MLTETIRANASLASLPNSTGADLIGSSNQIASTPEQRCKERLEAEKLSLEVANLRRWWAQPSFIQAVFGSLIALGALITGYSNGWFEVQRGRLEIQTAQLEDKRNALRAENLTLANTGAQLGARLEHANADLVQEIKARQQATESLLVEKQRTEYFSAELGQLNKRVAHRTSP